MTKHVMIDLETMDNTPTSAIIAIGAVVVDTEVTGALPVVSEFYRQVSLQSAVDAGLTVSPSTIMWWMQQSDQARSAFKDNQRAPTLLQALDGFSEFMANQDDIDRVWGNGADFDNAILRTAYDKVGRQLPWKYWQNACYRTLKGLFPDVKLARNGTYHNALDDARSQALHLLKLLEKVTT